MPQRFCESSELVFVFPKQMTLGCRGEPEQTTCCQNGPFDGEAYLGRLFLHSLARWPLGLVPPRVI